MANTRIATQQIVKAGLAPAYTGSLSAADTFLVANDGQTFLHVKNTGGGAATLTLNTPGSVDGNAIADPTVVIPATTGDKMIGPFPTTVYNQPGTNDIHFTFDVTTGVTVAALVL